MLGLDWSLSLSLEELGSRSSCVRGVLNPTCLPRDVPCSLI